MDGYTHPGTQKSDCGCGSNGWIYNPTYSLPYDLITEAYNDDTSCSEGT